jgi:ubiquinone/menaquinone biosynthesis C-methylase UbiE
MNFFTQSNEILFRQAVEQTCRKLKGNTLVDIGSGDGTETIRIARLINAKNIICVDHNQQALNKAKKRGCKIIKADLNQKISLPNNTANVIIINQVIEHVAQTDLLAKEVRRLLKNGGSSIWCTPNLASWHNIFALIFGYQPFSSQISDEAFLGNPLHPQYKQKIKEAQAHLRVFTHQSLKELLAYHGLTVTASKGVGYYPLPSALAKIMSKCDPKHAAYILQIATKNKN